MNRLGKSDNSFSRPRNNSLVHLEQSFNSPSTPKSNDVLSESQKSEKRPLPPREDYIDMIEMKEQLPPSQSSTPYKIHNCVCFVAQECLSYNCNCFLSPFPCTPECCPNCLILKSNLPLKISNVCNCKKTKCLKLYCECLAKGLFCSIMCTCELCENHSHSKLRKDVELMIDKEESQFRGCSCKKISCDKKYCQCFAQGIKCTSHCRCINCNNAQEIIPMQVQEPIEERVRFTVDVPEMAFQPPDLFGQNKKKRR